MNKAKTDNDETQKETKKKTNVTIASQRQLINTNGIMELSRNQSSALAANKDSWGDKMGEKKDGFLRLASRNIGGIGVYAGNSKEEELKTWIVNSEFDIFGLQELNLNVSKCRDRERIGERMKSPAWEFFKTATGHNKHYTGNKKMLYGGTVLLDQGQQCHRVASSGADERGLGRWAWFLLNGKDRIKTRVVTAYRPCKTTKLTSTVTVYNQHLQYFKDQNIWLHRVDLSCRILIKE